MAELRTEGLSIHFGGVMALDDVAIEVREWEITGIIGPNGAGKTTLFNCITGFYRTDAGRVWYRGRDVTALKPHERVELGLARTFQNVGLIRSMTVLENMLIAQHHHAGYAIPWPAALRAERRMRADALEICAFLGIDHLRDAPVSGLPYGTLKRIEIGRVLCTDPRLLMLDEPTSGMGPREAHQVGDILTRLRDELGLNVLLIEHHVPLVVDVCDQTYCLNFGRVLAAGTPQQVRDHPAVVEAYLGRGAA